MQKLLYLGLLMLQPFLALPAAAAPCASAPLATYTASSFSCSLGALDFSNFLVLPGPAVASPFAAININPVTTAPDQFGLEFVVNQTASAGELFEQLIGYRVTAKPGTAIDRNTLLFSGSSTTEDAVVSALEQKCVDGIFANPNGVSGCTGTAFNQAVLNILGVADPPIFTDLPGAGFLSVVSDIAVDGGALGTAALTSATNLFRAAGAPSVVAEPASLALALVAASALMLTRRRRTLAPVTRTAR